jgi:hypothetical protein
VTIIASGTAVAGTLTVRITSPSGIQSIATYPIDVN